MTTGTEIDQQETACPATDRRRHAARTIAELPADPAAQFASVPLVTTEVDAMVEDWAGLCEDLPDAAAVAERLRLLGIDDTGLRALLVSETVPDTDPAPAWSDDVDRWYARSAIDRERIVLFEGDAGLLTAVLPLLQGAVDELEDRVRARLTGGDADALGDLPHVMKALTQSSPIDSIGGLVLRTMVLELNVARVEGRLTGGTADERFAGYVALLSQPAVIETLWAEYPVLARLVAERVRYWIDTRLELLDHLIEDLPSLRSTVLPGDPGGLVAVRMGAGDGHRRGRSVAIVEFAHGRVVYKPRSLATDLAFDRVLAWMNDSSLRPELRRLVSIDRGTHGWVEHIDSDAATDSAGVDRYARRLGILSALLYALNATDFHLENVMAEGEHPVLVDLESVIHVELEAAPSTDPLLGPAHRALATSVYATGLVPAKILVNDENGSVAWDFSAIGGRGGQLSPFAVGAFDDEATDTMRFAPRRIEMQQESNLPRSTDGEIFELVGHREQFEQGLRDGYRLLMEHADELCAADGPLSGFDDAEARHIARATNIYARLLGDATHPDFLRRGSDRERVLSRLMRGLGEVAYREAMYLNEIAELRRGDIPLFTVHLGTGVVRGGDHDQWIGVMDEPPLTAVRARIRSLDEDDLTLQARITEMAFASTSMSGDRVWSDGRRRETLGAPAEAEEFAEAARRCALRIIDTAVRDEDGIGWLGLRLMDDQHWVLSATEFDLYSGISGIAVGLDAVAAATGDPVVDEVSLQILDQIGDLIRAQDAEKLRVGHTPSGPLDIGAMGPLAGTVHALATAAARRGDPALAAPAELLLPVLDAALDKDQFHDVIAGAAGTVLALLALEDARPGCGALDVAIRAGRRLLDHRTAGNGGAGWKVKLGSEPLAGLSHGASGIALALARLHAVSPDPAYLTAVRDAVTYERALFDPEVRNWKDLRDLNEKRDAGMVSWCHGAAGIGAARAALLDLGVPDPDGIIEQDRAAAVHTVAETGLMTDGSRGLGNHSLCHGDLGNLLILQDALTPADDPRMTEMLPQVWTAVLRDGTENGWISGVPKGVEVPGLMCGHAGIAWALARKAAPQEVADVLTLAAGPSGVRRAR